MLDINKKGKTEAKRVVLAYGEVTGHAHAIYDDGAAILEDQELTILKPTSLLHEEHGAHVLNPGVGTVTIQREYQMGEIKRVLD